MIIYKTDYITIHYHAEDQMIETVWHSFASSQGYRAALMQYLEAIKKYEVRRWLADHRESRVVRPVDQEWTVKEWWPLFMPLTGNLTKMARVKSHDISAQISSGNMRQELSELPCDFMEFDHYGEARAWVLS